MIKKFKLFEADEVELVEKGEFDIEGLMERLKDQENRIEFLTIFLNRILRDNYASFSVRDGGKIEKVKVKEIHILLNQSNEDNDTVLMSIFLRDDSNKDYCLHSTERITVFRIAGKTVITAEDPYGEEEWSY